MRLTRISLAAIAALTLAATFALVVPAAGAASSVDYAGGCIIKLSSVTVTPGEKVTVTASGFPAAAVVTFTLDPSGSAVKLGTVTADSSGTAVLTFTVPAGTTPGVHVVSATGAPAGQCAPSVQANVTVSAAAVTNTASQSGNLPRTGTNSAELFQIALILIALGGLVTLVARKRLSRTHAEP